jgi:non-heme chloroperoxidase
MPKFTQDGVTLSYTDSGTGVPPVVFIHGTGGSRSSFNAQAVQLERRHRVISLDLRGHGESARPESGYALSDYTRDVEALLAHLELKGALLVGHSLGGFIALDVAARGVSAIAGAVLLDSPMCVPKAVGESLAPLTVALQSADYPAVLENIIQQFFFLPAETSVVKAAVTESLLRLPKAIFNAAWSGTLGYDATSAFRKVRVPVLFLHGSVPADLELIGSIQPRVRVERLAGARGHFTHIIDPDPVTRAIERFIAQLG